MREEIEVKKDLFYRKADKFLLKIGVEDNYFNPDASGDNNNWNWLKKFAENVVEEMSANRRQKTLESSDKRHLEEIKYYINRYIFENKEQTINVENTNISSEDSYIIVYNYLKNILEKEFLNKINKNKKNIEDVINEDKKTIDKFVKHQIIKTETSGEQDDLSVNKEKLTELNKELNNYNYDYDNTKENQLKNIDFSINNYIYNAEDNEIKLLNIENNTYQNFLKDKSQVQEKPSVETGQIGSSTQAKLKNLILSIKNRYNMIQKSEQEQKINVYQGYITRGVFFYYKSILDELVSKLNTTTIQENDHIFLPISISIMIYDIIFKYIYNNMNDEEVIQFKNLNEGQNDMSKFATLFYVEMKPFLDQYKACDSTQKVKFFCNINDNEGALKNYDETEEVMTNIKTKIPIETSIETKRVFSIKEPQSDSVNYDTLTINTNTFENPNTINCKQFDVAFNKIFDKTKPQVMAPYIAASNVINNYEGLMLFTFGYSGVGKSFTIFGSGDTPGVLSSIFSSIQNVENIKVKIYEIYGMGLNKKENFDKNVYHKYVNYIIDTKKNSIIESNVVDKIDEIQGKNIQINYLPEFLKKLNSINDEIEDRRGKIKSGINYSVGALKDGDINIKTIKKTKNNPDSSRSILCYELIINKDGEEIPFIIVDLPGKEIIKDSFGEEGEALLKINSNNKINDEFLNNNFRNILKNIQTLLPEETDNIFEGIDIETEKNNKDIKVKYSILQDTIGETGLSFKIKKLQDAEVNINKDNIKIESTSDNDIENLILYIPNLLILKQKHKNKKEIANKIILPLDGKDGTFENKLYLGFNEDYSIFIEEITRNDYNYTKNDNIKFKLTLNLDENFKPYIEHAKLNFDNLKGEIDNALLNDNESNISYYSISVSDLQKLKQQSNIESNKVKLITAMNAAVNYSQPQQPQQPQQPHPILKLTQILDRINDKDYINEYEKYAEKCFRYTKSAEGIFINENINGIMQLMINKKGAGTDMKIIQNEYNESEMFYNQKNNSSFNNTLIYDNLYTQYEGNSNLRKIDNMYAFFVVANISKNQRIKQKLICNATKTEDGYKRDLGWECDEVALAKEREEALKQQKQDIKKDKEEKEEAKNKAIKEIHETLKNKNINYIDRIRRNDGKTIKIYFKNNHNTATNFLDNFNKKNKKLSNDQYISELAIELYNEMQDIELEDIRQDMKKDIIQNKEQVNKYSDNIIENFRELDTNNDGRIDIDEFKSAIKKQLPNSKIDDNMIQIMFNNIDKSKDGYITIDEFVADMKEQSGQGGGGDDRRLYIREMCKTQIALFKELQFIINKIVAPE